MTGYIYLLHFSRPISPSHTTQHYIGYTADLAARVQAHELGHAARLTAVARERGISFEIVRVWRGSRDDERRLKKWSDGPKFCPCCQEQPKNPRFLPEVDPAEVENLLIPF